MPIDIIVLFMSRQERLLLVASPINPRQTSLSISSAVTGPGHIKTRLKRDHQAEGLFRVELRDFRLEISV